MDARCPAEPVSFLYLSPPDDLGARFDRATYSLLLRFIHHHLTPEKRACNIVPIQWPAQSVAACVERQPYITVQMNSLGHKRSPEAVDISRSLIFIVEDEPDVAGLISHTLRSGGFDVQSFADGTSVISEGVRLRPALFLLDVMLPGADGFELCRQIRKTEMLSATPIVFLTARSSEADRIKGLELGGDDYITKPFSPRELLARVRGVLRASRQPMTEEQILRLGELEIDALSMTVNLRGRNVPATVREFRLLEYLAVHRGRVLTRDQLLDAVWNETRFVTPRSIDVYIRRLREKIETDSRHPRYLKTLRGIGYRFEIPK